MTIEKKEDILIKSARIISEDGIENYSMQKLADELGVRKASLYHHYKSKDEILRAMHDYFHAMLMKKGYRMMLSDNLEDNLSDLVSHWQNLFLSEEMYDYLRCLLIMRQTDQRSYEEWRSISLTIEGQSQVVIERHAKSAQMISPLFSALLELSLERALINGESGTLEELSTSFPALLHRL
ncbi:MAG TPA: TetR/AcrR family transcriptional regulator [Candidatus Ornithospirochaeta stercorigallinarum]|nr:TetR/AcrR family transcriptional regulator [Candidatus Ornithospirochaeta stercorigallinarum]